MTRLSQPSCPKSSVNFLTLNKSSVLTVGRVVDRDRSMSDMQTMGSSSLSLDTSIQVISMAAGSPGEHGVRRSSTIN